METIVAACSRTECESNRPVALSAPSPEVRIQPNRRNDYYETVRDPEIRQPLHITRLGPHRATLLDGATCAKAQGGKWV